MVGKSVAKIVQEHSSKKGGAKLSPKLQELARTLRERLEAFLQDQSVAITAPVFTLGASQYLDAETLASQQAYQVWEAAWSMFGHGATAEQVIQIIWPIMGNVRPEVRLAFGLPVRKEEVLGFLWKIWQEHSGRYS